MKFILFLSFLISIIQPSAAYWALDFDGAMGECILPEKVSGFSDNGEWLPPSYSSGGGFTLETPSAIKPSFGYQMGFSLFATPQSGLSFVYGSQSSIRTSSREFSNQTRADNEGYSYIPHDYRITLDRYQDNLKLTTRFFGLFFHYLRPSKGTFLWEYSLGVGLSEFFHNHRTAHRKIRNEYYMQNGSLVYADSSEFSTTSNDILFKSFSVNPGFGIAYPLNPQFQLKTGIRIPMTLFEKGGLDRDWYSTVLTTDSRTFLANPMLYAGIRFSFLHKK